MYCRAQCFIKFFSRCMAVPGPCRSIKNLLFELTEEYVRLYNLCVSKTTGSFEKRQKAGEVMIYNLEHKRGDIRNIYRAKFASLECIKDTLSLSENEATKDNPDEESNLIYCYIEDLLYSNFWKWMQKEKGSSVGDFMKERDSDTSYDFSPIMLDKLYDITGYLCGHRIKNLVVFNRLKSDYKSVFNDYHLHSRLPNGHMALSEGLPAECLLFREHSGGLYYSKKANFEFIKIIQAIWIQCLTTDVLIIFNSQEPVKLVHKLLLNSQVVQSAFKKSCCMLLDCFTSSINLATDLDPISYLYQFLIQGFVRVYAKDIYQLRLSNVLMSKSGASGIRTTLLTLSATASKKKNILNKEIDERSEVDNLPTSDAIVSRDEEELSYFNCPCGKGYKEKSKTWYARHISLCSKYIFLNSSSINDEPPTNRESVMLDNLVELECSEDLGDFMWDVDPQMGIDLETKSDEDENNFDKSFVSNVVIDENDEKKKKTIIEHLLKNFVHLTM